MQKELIVPVLFFTVLLILSSCNKEDDNLKRSVTNFEEIPLNDEGYYNGSDGLGGFVSGNAKFKTFYNADWGSWSGFSVSNHTDSVTAGYSNQYSAIAGSGASNSEKYAILYSFSADTVELITPARVTNISITNSTYAYFTIRYGNDFATMFGGQSGDSPDYFHLNITLVDSAGVEKNISPIALADYTSEDPALDRILRGWLNIDFSAAGYIKYIIFKFDSSDKGEWGINTPTYVCIDNLVTEWEE